VLPPRDYYVVVAAIPKRQISGSSVILPPVPVKVVPGDLHER